MRPVVLGNSRLYLGFDDRCSLKELFWPTVGLENHIRENSRNRLILWFRGIFREVGASEWKVKGGYQTGMMFRWLCEHQVLPLSLEISDCVDPYKQVWVRKVVLQSPKDEKVGIYMRQAYALGENTIGESAFWHSGSQCLYHYKGEMWIASRLLALSDEIPALAAIAKVRDGGVGMDEYSGAIRGSSIDHGLVESMLGALLPSDCQARTIQWAFAFGNNQQEADAVLDQASKLSMQGVAARSRAQWGSLSVPESVSLKVLLSHTDKNGAIIASCDTDVMGDFRDHYRYVWHRDAAMCASAMARQGLLPQVEKYLEFCERTITDRGFFWQRYRPDGIRGSSWHEPNLPSGELPIQQDETSLALVTAGDYLMNGGSLEFLESIYDGFIKKAAQFILDYTCFGGTLCKPSYDLWEERRGIFSFTQASCAVGLFWASTIAKRLGLDDADEFFKAALGLTDGLVKVLSTPSQGFSRGIPGGWAKGEFQYDWTPDSSLFLIPLLYSRLGDGQPPGKRLETILELSKTTWKRLGGRLAVPDNMGASFGIARYKGDWYCRPENAQDAPGNPWLISTAWRVMSGLELGFLGADVVSEALAWFDARSLFSGIMPEQVDCVSFVPVSVAPLAWSHATLLELQTAARGKLVYNKG